MDNYNRTVLILPHHLYFDSWIVLSQILPHCINSPFQFDSYFWQRVIVHTYKINIHNCLQKCFSVDLLTLPYNFTLSSNLQQQTSVILCHCRRLPSFVALFLSFVIFCFPLLLLYWLFEIQILEKRYI